MGAKDAVAIFTVEGRWPFPNDMLRYDDAEPATDADQQTIARLSGDYSEDTRSRVRIRLRTTEPKHPVWEPCSRRWESFGWKVVEGAPYAEFKREHEALEARRSKLFESAMAKLTDEERRAVRYYSREAK